MNQEKNRWKNLTPEQIRNMTKEERREYTEYMIRYTMNLTGEDSMTTLKRLIKSAQLFRKKHNLE